MQTLRIPYFGQGGEEVSVRFQIALDGDCLRWKSGAKPNLYGLNRVAKARAAGEVVFCQDESDVLTFWQHGIPALGIPGTTNWREERDAQIVHAAGENRGRKPRILP
jgi:hypothetical protein